MVWKQKTMSIPNPKAEAAPIWRAALSDAALRDLAGAAVFGRGQTYAGSGAIEDADIPALEPGEQMALAAVVRGTQRYETRVWIDADDQVDGDCDCPHAEDGHFCKHQVALALTLRGRLGGDMPEVHEVAAKKVAAAAKRAATQTRNRQALKAFVEGQSAQALAQLMWRWAEDDRDLMAELKAWAVASQAGGDAKALTAVITDLLRDHRGFLDWREAGAYAARAEKILPLLRPCLQQDPAQLRALCEHALRRIYKVAEHADDSDGRIGGLMQSLIDLLVQALRASPPSADWVDNWFKLMAEDPWGLWNEAEVLAAAGRAVQARYAQRVARDWQNWLTAHPPTPTEPAKRRPGLAGQGDRFDFERSQLRRRYLNSLKQQGDVQAVIDALRAHLSGANEHSELVGFCEEHGRFREALVFAQAAHKTFPKDWSIENDLLRCYERDGWDEEALEIRRRQLEVRPEPSRFQAVLAAAGRAGRDVGAYRAQLFAWAEARERDARPDPWYRPMPGRMAATTAPDVSVRVNWLLAEGKTEAALALAQPPHRCSHDLLRTLARSLPQARNAQAVPLLQRVFDAVMAGASSPYHEPLALVREVVARMPPEQGRQWLSYLRAQYKAKRNFIKELPAS